MALDALLRAWRGVALRHIPAASPFGVLDFRFAGQSAENRWNEPGHPTLYLAGDEGVLIAEWGRHFATNRTPGLQRATIARAVFALDLAMDRTLDLRDPAVCAALSIGDAPYAFTDVAFARATAHFVRATTAAQALLVPSMAFLDDPTRWCLVAFLDKLPADPADFITAATPRGPLTWEA